MSNTLGKKTKLKGKAVIQELFQNGRTTRKGPLRVVFMDKIVPGTSHHIGFTVSKRFFKNATDRNKVKRLMREAYRLQQHELSVPYANSLHMMFIYQSNKMPDIAYLKKLTKNQIKELNKKFALKS
jgi:ribonuclease P protein component